mmetsp:Transcript_66827/g.196170  ORF Transcript_66827/g.196170 Transcript_66827/m.196170 type:complete len:308 (+) Transcript_66827:400-1323(+)
MGYGLGAELGPEVPRRGHPGGEDAGRPLRNHRARGREVGGPRVHDHRHALPGAGPALLPRGLSSPRFRPRERVSRLGVRVGPLGVQDSRQGCRQGQRCQEGLEEEAEAEGAVSQQGRGPAPRVPARVEHHEVGHHGEAVGIDVQLPEGAERRGGEEEPREGVNQGPADPYQPPPQHHGHLVHDHLPGCGAVVPAPRRYRGEGGPQLHASPHSRRAEAHGGGDPGVPALHHPAGLLRSLLQHDAGGHHRGLGRPSVLARGEGCGQLGAHYAAKHLRHEEQGRGGGRPRALQPLGVRDGRRAGRGQDGL